MAWHFSSNNIIKIVKREEKLRHKRQVIVLIVFVILDLIASNLNKLDSRLDSKRKNRRVPQGVKIQKPLLKGLSCVARSGVEPETSGL